MNDSCSDRKLDPGLAATYSKPSDLNTSTMKSDPGRSVVITSTCATGSPSGGPGPILTGGGGADCGALQKSSTTYQVFVFFGICHGRATLRFLCCGLENRCLGFSVVDSNASVCQRLCSRSTCTTRRRWCFYRNGSSEVELCVEFDEPGRLDRARLLPRGPERVVLHQHRVRVHDVIDIGAHRRAGAAEPQDLRQAQVDLIHPLPIVRPGRDEVHRDVARATRKIAAERRP